MKQSESPKRRWWIVSLIVFVVIVGIFLIRMIGQQGTLKHTKELAVEDITEFSATIRWVHDPAAIRTAEICVTGSSSAQPVDFEEKELRLTELIPETSYTVSVTTVDGKREVTFSTLKHTQNAHGLVSNSQELYYGDKAIVDSLLSNGRTLQDLITKGHIKLVEQGKVNRRDVGEFEQTKRYVFVCRVSLPEAPGEARTRCVLKLANGEVYSIEKKQQSNSLSIMEYEWLDELFQMRWEAKQEQYFGEAVLSLWLNDDCAGSMKINIVEE